MPCAMRKRRTTTRSPRSRPCFQTCRRRCSAARGASRPRSRRIRTPCSRRRVRFPLRSLRLRYLGLETKYRAIPCEPERVKECCSAHRTRHAIRASFAIKTAINPHSCSLTPSIASASSTRTKSIAAPPKHIRVSCCQHNAPPYDLRADARAPQDPRHARAGMFLARRHGAARQGHRCRILGHGH